MESRTMGALALRPTDNAQGGYYLYSLATGMCLNRTHWTELPMPSSVEYRHKCLARCTNADRGLLFQDSDGGDLDLLYPDNDDESEDSDYDPDYHTQARKTRTIHRLMPTTVTATTMMIRSTIITQPPLTLPRISTPLD
jgi:hypothetical protein